MHDQWESKAVHKNSLSLKIFVIDFAEKTGILREKFEHGLSSPPNIATKTPKIPLCKLPMIWYQLFILLKKGLKTQLIKPKLSKFLMCAKFLYSSTLSRFFRKDFEIHFLSIILLKKLIENVENQNKTT